MSRRRGTCTARRCRALIPRWLNSFSTKDFNPLYKLIYPHSRMMDAERRLPQDFTITLVGDIMLGRLVDQLLPTHVDEPEEAALVSHFKRNYPHLQNYTHASPWGNALDLFKRSDLVLGNLETSVTTHDVKWPDKVFNYRMHPENLKCLVEAQINYVSLANNHTLDFSQQGLLETVRSLEEAQIAYAGAGETAVGTTLPAELFLPSQEDRQNGTEGRHNIHIYSFSDHPEEWSAVKEFNLLEYTSDYKQRLCDTLTAASPPPSLKIVSVHWGPNYRWQPSQEIRDMAHHMIDQCGVDVVWGHSSHHIQGVEIYAGKLIIYGCGDFVDDYAVNQQYRNDLSAAWTLNLKAIGQHLAVQGLEIRPNRIQHFQSQLLDETDIDHKWIVTKFRGLCTELGTKVQESLGPDDQIVVDLSKQ